MLLQHTHRVVGKTLDHSIVALRREAQKLFCQCWNILRPVPQRRHVNRHHMQPEEKIFPHATIGHDDARIAIRSRNHPHRNRLRHLRANPLKGSFLQESQQFRLDLDLHVAHFVEKQSAAVGRFAPTLLIVNRAGECTFLVAE